MPENTAQKILTHMIGVGELAVTREPNHSIKTMALGSCVAVVILAPEYKAIGMAHIALPDSSLDRAKAAAFPGYFADTAIPTLIQEMCRIGCTGNPVNFVVKLIGGAQILDSEGHFNIGKRNILSTKKALWTMKMGATREDVGGDISRTVEVFQASGAVIVSNPSKGKWEI